MKCKCSLDNNYEVIGLCYLDEFNDKISEFEDESWSQISISKIANIDSTKPSIKNIFKAYMDIKITSSEIIEGPKTDTPNIEGLNLTGKMLLVSGVIYQRIIYVSNDGSMKTHSIKFKDNFSSHIVLDENVEPKKDNYCVYPFIENISLDVLNPQSINKNIQMFLFAHKIDLNTEINIPNEFVFYSSTNFPQREVTRITFDSDNKLLKATSTTNLYNEEDLSFSLTNNIGSIIRAKGTLKRNKDGMDFASKLNNQPFKIGDLIRLDYTIYKNTSRLINYPNRGNTYDMRSLSDHTFKITKDGIVPYILPAIISLNSTNRTTIINIGFDILSKTLLAHMPTLEFTNPTYRGQEYFRMVVKNSNSEEKYHASIQGGMQGQEIARNLLNKPFEYGDIVELIYKEGDKVQITNTPYLSADRYTLTGTKKSFRITKTGLVQI